MKLIWESRAFLWALASVAELYLNSPTKDKKEVGFGHVEGTFLTPVSDPSRSETANQRKDLARRMMCNKNRASFGRGHGITAPRKGSDFQLNFYLDPHEAGTIILPRSERFTYNGLMLPTDEELCYEL